MKSPFQSVAKLYRDNGYSVLPLMANSKRPSIEGWSRFCLDTADEEIFQRWMSWKGNNIGVCLGVASGIVGYDLDDDVDGLHDKIKRLLPETPLAKKGAKGCTLFFRYNGESSKSFSKGGVRVLDILSTGRQTVCPPSMHPDTLKPYEWLSGDMATIKSEDLPIIPSSVSFQIALLFESGAKPSEYIAPKYTQVYDDADDQEISNALNFINADDYDLWIQVGMSIKEALGEKGFSFWHHWSSGSSKFNAKEIRSKWDSFKRTGLTIATLFYHALDGGYHPESQNIEHIPDFELNGFMTGWHPEQHKPKPEIVVITNLEEEPEPVEDFPARLVKGMGLPAIMAEYMENTAMNPQPILSLGASIALAGTIMGHKISTERDLRTNFYNIGLAYSGAGKNHSKNMTMKILEEMGLEQNIMGRPRSAAGLVACLRDQNKANGFLVWDEIGRVLKQITNKNAGNHEKEIITTLMEMFTTASSTYAGYAYANNDGKNPPKPVVQPCINLWGISVPQHFYESMGNGDVSDGYLPRLLIFESKQYTLDEEDKTIFDVPEHIVKEINLWKNRPTNSYPKGDVDLKIRPKIIFDDEKAKKLIKEYQRETRLQSIYDQQACDPKASIVSRSAEHARKLALVSSNYDVITYDVMRWAVDLSEHLTNKMINAVYNNVSSNEYEANLKKIFVFLNDRSKNEDTEWVTKSDLINKFQHLKVRDLNDIMSSLSSSLKIEEITQKTSGRPKTVYRVNRKL